MTTAAWSIPLPLAELETFCLAASPEARQQLVSRHLDAQSEDGLFTQLLAWQTEDVQRYAQDEEKPAAASLPLRHTSAAYAAALQRLKDKWPHSERLRVVSTRHELLSIAAVGDEKEQRRSLQRLMRVWLSDAQQDGPQSLQADDGKAASASPSYPAALPESLLSLPSLLSAPFSHSSGLSGISGQGLDAFSSSPLAADAIAQHLLSHSEDAQHCLHRFLSQLTSPAVPQLLELIVLDMALHQSAFGSLRVHSMLTTEQLLQLSRQRAEVAEQSGWLQAVLQSMKPDGELDALNAKQRLDWHASLCSFVLQLKARLLHWQTVADVLHAALSFQLQQGLYDLQLLREFLALPLPAASPLKAREQTASQKQPVPSVAAAALGSQPQAPLQHRYQPLLDAFIRRFFGQRETEAPTDAASRRELSKLLESRVEPHWLRQQQAIARLQAVDDLTQAEREECEAQLSAGQLREERERRLLSFSACMDESDSPVNALRPSAFLSAELPLSLTLKNVGSQLLVKLYRLDALQYYRLQAKEVDAAALQLDGVVAHSEWTEQLPACSAFRRFTRTLRLTEKLDAQQQQQRGVFVCEVTAAGLKARALLRRGLLSFVSRCSVRGVQLQLFDAERAEAVSQPRVTLAGREYAAGSDGQILLPYRPAGEQQAADAAVPLILSASDASGGDFHTLVSFTHPVERYELYANLQLDRESLLPAAASAVVARPSLMLNGTRVSVSLLRRLRARLELHHGDGVSSSQLLDGLQATDDAELLLPFTVPSRLRRVELKLEADVQQQSSDDPARVASTYSWTVSEDMAAAAVEEEGLDDLYLRHGTDGYAVFVLGQAGEPVAHRIVRLSLQHRLLSPAIAVTLQTDASGAVRLGQLPGIEGLSASISRGAQREHSRHWQQLQRDGAALPQCVHSVETEDITIPYPLRPAEAAASSAAAAAELFTLLQVDSASPSVIRRYLPLSSHLQRSAGFVRLSGLTAGRYLLLMKEVGPAGSSVDISVAAQPLQLGSSDGHSDYALAGRRVLQLANAHAAASIAAVELSGSAVVIRTAHASASARLLVVASHFLSDRPHGFSWSPASSPAPTSASLPVSYDCFLAQRLLGSEAQYILDRKAAVKRVGNLLPRPSLLNHELLRRATDFDQDQQLSSGQAYAPQPQQPQRGGGGPGSQQYAPAAFGAPSFAFASSAHSGFGSSGPLFGASFSSGAPRHHAKRFARAAPRQPQCDASVAFVSAPSARLLNLKPAEDGSVSIPLSSLSPWHSHLRIVLVDDGGRTQAELGFPVQPVVVPAASSPPPSALRLHPHYADIRFSPPQLASAQQASSSESEPQQAERFFVERQLVSQLEAGQKLQLAVGCRLAVYDTLDDALRLLRALLSSSPAAAAELDRFSPWLLRWPSLTQEEKLSRYSAFACHELHLFLFHKDAAFFTAVVLPYLQEKLCPVFIDRWLLNEGQPLLDAWLPPARFAKLSIVEQLLLARRAQAIGQPSAASRIFAAVKDRVAARPPQTAEEETRLFETALSVKSGGKAEMEELEQAAQQQQQPQQPAVSSNAVTSMQVGGAPLAFGAPAPAAAPAPARAMAMMSRAKAAPLDDKQATARSTFGGDGAEPEAVRRLYSSPPTTKEYQERGWWALTYDAPQSSRGAELISPGLLWSDYAQHCLQAMTSGGSSSGTQAAFVSRHLATACSSFPDVLLALAVTELPFACSSSPPAVLSRSAAQNGLTLTAPAASTALLFREERQEAPLAAEAGGPLLSVSVRYQDSLQLEAEADVDAEAEDAQPRHVEEFVAGRAYTCSSVLFNPSPSRLRVRVLQQIPSGSVSLSGVGSRSSSLTLDSLSNAVLQSSFYFPAVGQFGHRAIQVSRGEEVIAFSPLRLLPVTVKEQAPVDLTHWRHVAAAGTDQQVLDFLAAPANNPHRLDLSLLSSRCRVSKAFWSACIAVLQQRLLSSQQLEALALHHYDAAALRHWLPTVSGLVDAVGPYFASSLLRVDAASELQDSLHHLEYRPLISSRAHRLRAVEAGSGGSASSSLFIQNRQLRDQYTALLTYLCYRYSDGGGISSWHRLQLCLYLLLQDRVTEAMELFASVPQPPAEQRLHYEYLAAYLALYTEPSESLRIARRYLQHPVTRQRRLFAAIEAQVAEITTRKREELEPDVDADDDEPALSAERRHEAEMEQLSATEPSLDFTVAEGGAGRLVISYSNLRHCRLAVHRLDIEQLFSSEPFLSSSEAAVQSSSAAAASTSPFLFLLPNEEQRLSLPAVEASVAGSYSVSLPAHLLQSNLLLTLSAGSLSVSRPLYSHSLQLGLVEAYGQLRLTAAASEAKGGSGSRPVSRAYVKVYARSSDTSPSFYKDGYTDWRGRFDYASLSTDRLRSVTRFAILVMSEEHGAVVREARPPGKSG